MMYWLQIFRLAVLSWVILCAIIELGLGAHSLAAVSTLDLPTFAWTGLGVAVAVLTLLTLPVMLTIDLIRTGAFTSLIVVELAWFGFLGVLFLATGGSAADRAANFWVTCDLWTPAEARNICAETSAAAAFGILAWFFLWAYSTTLLVMLILHASRGHYVWNTSVKEANFGAGLPPKTTTAPVVNAYGAEAKPHENASLNPGQPPYAYPPGAPPAATGYNSPQTTGYNSPQTTGYNSPQTTGYGQPAGAHPSAYPQV